MCVSFRFVSHCLQLNFTGLCRRLRKKFPQRNAMNAKFYKDKKKDDNNSDNNGNNNNDDEVKSKKAEKKNSQPKLANKQSGEGVKEDGEEEEGDDRNTYEHKFVEDKELLLETEGADEEEAKNEKGTFKLRYCQYHLCTVAMVVVAIVVVVSLNSCFSCSHLFQQKKTVKRTPQLSHCMCFPFTLYSPLVNSYVCSNLLHQAHGEYLREECVCVCLCVFAYH